MTKRLRLSCIAVLAAAAAILGCTPADAPGTKAESPPPLSSEERVPVAVPLAQAPGADRLLGAWLLVDLAGTPIAAEFQTTIEFSPDGQAGGTAGCNQYSGRYTFDDGALAFPGAFATTRMMCPEPVMAQEDAYLEALGRSRHATLDEPYLFLTIEGSEQPLQFRRVEETADE